VDTLAILTEKFQGLRSPKQSQTALLVSRQDNRAKMVLQDRGLLQGRQVYKAVKVCKMVLQEKTAARGVAGKTAVSSPRKG
jgi:hypothetical protein